MSILPDIPPPINPTDWLPSFRPAHDPTVCGLGLPHLCPACAAEGDDARTPDTLPGIDLVDDAEEVTTW